MHISLGAPVGGFMNDWLGWRWAFWMQVSWEHLEPSHLIRLHLGSDFRSCLLCGVLLRQIRGSVHLTVSTSSGDSN